MAKTQLILFKSLFRRLTAEFTLTIDGHTINTETSVKLLGLTLDHHLTMGNHIDATVRKCHGLLGALSRAAKEHPRSLLKLAYTSVIHSHLEYGSAVFATAAVTHLKKLDVIQRIAARIIFGLPRDVPFLSTTRRTTTRRFGKETQ